MKTSLFPLSWIACAVLLVGCAGNPAIQQSHVLLAQGHIEDSVRVLEKAMQAAPDDLELRAEYFRQRDRLSSQLLTEAESARVARNFDAAQALYTRVQTLDANNPRAREGLLELSAQQQREQRIGEAQALIDADKLPAAERLLRSVVAESPMDGSNYRGTLSLPLGEMSRFLSGQRGLLQKFFDL